MKIVKIRNGIADKIKPSHMVEILRKIKTLNGKNRFWLFTKDGLEFDVSLTTYGDIVISIKHCL